jgi:hypothetical protein
LYATGHGVERDRTGPIKLWAASAAQGFETAIENLKKNPEENGKSNEKEHDKEQQRMKYIIKINKIL